MKDAWIKFKSFILESRRVLRVTRKPSKDEFKAIVKASSLGMALIGMLGFIIHIMKQFLFPPTG